MTTLSAHAFLMLWGKGQRRIEIVQWIVWTSCEYISVRLNMCITFTCVQPRTMYVIYFLYGWGKSQGFCSSICEFRKLCLLRNVFTDLPYEISTGWNVIAAWSQFTGKLFSTWESVIFSSSIQDVGMHRARQKHPTLYIALVRSTFNI